MGRLYQNDSPAPSLAGTTAASKAPVTSSFGNLKAPPPGPATVPLAPSPVPGLAPFQGLVQQPAGPSLTGVVPTVAVPATVAAAAPVTAAATVAAPTNVAMGLTQGSHPVPGWAQPPVAQGSGGVPTGVAQGVAQQVAPSRAALPKGSPARAPLFSPAPKSSPVGPSVDPNLWSCMQGIQQSVAKVSQEVQSMKRTPISPELERLLTNLSDEVQALKKRQSQAPGLTKLPTVGKQSGPPKDYWYGIYNGVNGFYGAVYGWASAHALTDGVPQAEKASFHTESEALDWAAHTASARDRAKAGARPTSAPAFGSVRRDWSPNENDTFLPGRSQVSAPPPPSGSEAATQSNRNPLWQF